MDEIDDRLERGQLRWWRGHDDALHPILIVGRIPFPGYEDEWRIQFPDGRLMQFTERIILGHCEVVNGEQ